MSTALLAAATLAAVATYLRWVLPRSRPLPATVAGVAFVLLGTALSVVVAPWCWLPTVGLAFGHIGWALHRWYPRATTVPATSSAPATIPAAAPRLGANRAALGRYRIGRELGRGSMGAVYLGHDPQAGRPVAIKTMALSREFAGPELADARTRFFREAQTAGRLQHPDIVAIFDAGEEEGLVFIAMEYVAGGDLLCHTLPGRLLPVATVLRAVQRVALALAHAHRQGVVHRDIKPANVMFDAATGAVKVTDFGIASLADACRTRTGLLLGTPSFMSPEQLAGRRVDGRTDLYALGVMLFQLLTGALPHRADSMAQLMHRIANDPAPDVRTVRPELPESLAKVVARALEKRPELRYADGRQMADDLGALVRLLQPEPVGLGTGKTPEAQIAENPQQPPDAGQSANFESPHKLARADPRHNSLL